MSLAYVVAKFVAKMFILYTLAAILDFAILDHFLDLSKMQSFFLNLHDILSQNQVKNQF